MSYQRAVFHNGVYEILSRGEVHDAEDRVSDVRRKKSDEENEETRDREHKYCEKERELQRELTD